VTGGRRAREHGDRNEREARAAVAATSEPQTRERRERVNPSTVLPGRARARLASEACDLRYDRARPQNRVWPVSARLSS
jgi:hypothetical protein